MKQSIKIQMKLLLISKNYNIVLILVFLFSLAPTLLYSIKFWGADINSVPPAYSLFIGSAYTSYFNQIFYVVFPIIAVLPFADSYYRDKKSGILFSVLPKTGINNYYFGKLFAVLFSGFSVVFIPMIISYLINLAVFPINSDVEFINGFGPIQNQLYTAYPDDVEIIFSNLFSLIIIYM
ncbi:MAG: hypothetical protein LUG21_05615, partial [Clostridiales bacterium]|nr:hypothetical protein [Clostridiales bacterium]